MYVSGNGFNSGKVAKLSKLKYIIIHIKFAQFLCVLFVDQVFPQYHFQLIENNKVHSFYYY